jgi:hypothetical protein
LQGKRRTAGAGAAAGLALGVMAFAGSAGRLQAQKAAQATASAGTCSAVVFEGDVKAGESFEKVFAGGLKFYLEPLRSGWIVRVLAASEPRGPHDYAELATPPYNSVTPLLIGTDWSFRAQDAVAWNPRRFRYAADAAAFRRLAALYGWVVGGDAVASAQAAELVSRQPEGVLEILDARIVPGVADQGQMAAMVASHFASTPHTVEQTAASSPLGRLQELRFRVELDLPPGAHVAKGLQPKKIPCPLQPARQLLHPSN